MLPAAAEPVFRAIADPSRRAIIDLLAAGEMTTGAIAGRFDMSRPAVVKHLKILREGGVVMVRRDGRNRFNRLNARALKPAGDWLQQYEKYWEDNLARLKARVEEETRP